MFETMVKIYVFLPFMLLSISNVNATRWERLERRFNKSLSQNRIENAIGIPTKMVELSFKKYGDKSEYFIASDYYLAEAYYIHGDYS